MLLIAGPSHMTTHVLNCYFKHTSSAFLVASCWFFSSSFRTKELSSTFFLCSILNSWLPPFESYGKNTSQFGTNVRTFTLAQIFQFHIWKVQVKILTTKYFIITIDRKKTFHIVIYLPFFQDLYHNKHTVWYWVVFYFRWLQFLAKALFA